MALGLTILFVFMILVVSELLWRWRSIDAEYLRKFVHISVGSFVAFWPLFLSWNMIIALSAAFVIVVIVSKYWNIFGAIHSVQRSTWGELLFAVAVGAVAYVTRDGWIYCAALLHMSVADGMAAVIGIRFGKPSQYLLFGYTKSIAGTLTFFIFSMAILIGYSTFSSAGFSLWFIVVALIATLLENIAVRGLDNLLVPILVALVLSALK